MLLGRTGSSVCKSGSKIERSSRASRRRRGRRRRERRRRRRRRRQTKTTTRTNGTRSSLPGEGEGQKRRGEKREIYLPEFRLAADAVPASKECISHSGSSTEYVLQRGWRFLLRSAEPVTEVCYCFRGPFLRRLPLVDRVGFQDLADSLLPFFPSFSREQPSPSFFVSA